MVISISDVLHARSLRPWIFRPSRRDVLTEFLSYRVQQIKGRGANVIRDDSLIYCSNILSSSEVIRQVHKGFIYEKRMALKRSRKFRSMRDPASYRHCRNAVVEFVLQQA